jgi:hypothetical protein
MAEKITLLEVDVKMDQAILDTAKLKEETLKLKEEADSYRGTEKENTAEHVKAQAAYKASAAELKSNEASLVKLTTANKENSGTIQKLEAENNKLRIAQKSLNLETKEGIAKNKEINAKINENTEFIKKNVDASTQNKMSIGGYSEALGKMGGKFGGVISGFTGMVKGAWAFIATPIGAILAAIVVVVTSLVGVFKKFQPLIEWFEQKIAAVTAVFNVFKDALLSWLSGSKSLSDSFSNLGGAMADAAKRAIELKKAQQELEDQQNILVESEAKAKRQIDELLLQSKNRTLSEKERMELIDKALEVEEKAYNKKKKMADDEYAQKVEEIAINNRLTEEQKKNLQEQGAAYLQELQAQKGIDDDEIKAFAELSAKRESILGESISFREKAMNRQDVLAEKLAEKELKRIEKAKELADKKLEEETKEREKSIEEAKKLNEQYLDAEQKLADLERELRLQAFEKHKEDKEKQREWERNRLAIDLENEMQIRVLNNESQFEIERDDLANRTAIEIEQAKKTGANIVEIQTKYSLAKREIDRAEMAARMELAAGFAGNIATIFGKNTKVGKAAASAQTAISGFQGAISAYSSLAPIPIVGPALGAAAAAAALVASGKAIKDIWAVKSGLPGDIGGGSTTTSTGGVSVNPSIGNGIVSRSVTQSNNQVNVNTQPTLVIDKVTEAQQQQERMSKTQTI